jgi:hypothetical protein
MSADSGIGQHNTAQREPAREGDAQAQQLCNNQQAVARAAIKLLLH